MYRLRAQMIKYKTTQPLYRTNVFIQVRMNVKIPTLPSTIPVCIDSGDTFSDVLNRIIDQDTRLQAVNSHVRFSDLHIWTSNSNQPMDSSYNVFTSYSPSSDGSLSIQYNS
ncbi:hypothetical protein LPJ68_004497 [Coemansia sp. RSA 1086]|nr:hypothetical protein LPJ68_004497 [Coemansia sp. RSA 1086]